MKFATSILLVTLIASMSTLMLKADNSSASTTNVISGDAKPTDIATGACTPGSCSQCARDGGAKFCTTCVNKTITGAGNRGRCEGEAPTGCLATQYLDGKVVCAECDEKDNYHLIMSSGFICVKCDLSANYLSGSSCKKAETLVENCSFYAPPTGICRECKAGYQLSENVCYPLPEGCAYSDAPHLKNYCSHCSNGFVSKDGTCPEIEAANCQMVVPNSTSRCMVCNSGYYIKDASCLPIKVRNC